VSDGPGHAATDDTRRKIERMKKNGIQLEMKYLRTGTKDKKKQFRWVVERGGSAEEGGRR
jgi:hypothetical protein